GLRRLLGDRGRLPVGRAVAARRAAPGRRQGPERLLRSARDRMVSGGAAAQGRAAGAGARHRAGPAAGAGGRLRRRHRRGHSRPARRRPQGTRTRARFMTDLLAFASAIASGAIEVVDLTHTLSPEFPTIVMPPELGQCAPFRMEEISRYDERGPAWYWNNISMGEHTGTHFDAPVHWISGKDLPHNSVDTIPPANFIAPAVVIDISEQSAKNADYELTVADIEAWEKQHGRIPARNWVLLRTDWSKRSGRDY